MKRYIFLFCLIVYGGYSPSYAKASPAHYHTLTVHGSHKAKAAPDMAMLHLGILAESLELDQAKDQADQKLKAFYAITEKLGIESRHMYTEHMRVQPSYHYGKDGKKTLRAYQVSYDIRLTLIDIGQVPIALQSFVDADIDRMHQFHYGLRDESKAKNDALITAFNKAEHKAKLLAKASGRRLGDVVSVKEHGAQTISPIMPVYAESAMLHSRASSPSAAPPIGELEIQADISVVYQLQ